jgi:AsmA-like C-terminal region
MKQENAGVLSIRTEVNNGVFVAGGNQTPDFRNLNGMMELKNRQFLLRNMTGVFGASPCKLEGGISDFALPPPAVFTATLTLQPSRDEVRWLLGKERFSNFAFDGSSTIQLSGSGPADDFHTSARWDLTKASYAYPDVIEKSRGIPNRLSAEIILNKDAFSVSSFTYELPPVTVNGSASYRLTGRKYLSVKVQSNKFDISKAVLFLPALRKFDPHGSFLIDIAGRGDPDKPDSFFWKGKTVFTKVAFKPAAAIKPVSDLTGAATFQGAKMETSLIKARIGDDLIYGKCSINNFRRVNATCQFDAPLLQATDLGLYSSDSDVNFHEVKGQITINDNNLAVDRLSMRHGKSIFNFSGNVSDFADPKIVATLNSPFISSDDVVSLLTLKYQNEDAPSGVRLELNLHVDAGTFNGVDFRKLDSGLKFAKGILNIESLDAVVLDGNLKGKGEVDIRPDGQNVYKINLALDRMSLDRLQDLRDSNKHTITGNLWLTGDVTATGSKLTDLERTAIGTFQVKAENGVLKKFSVLSKIFSLLNVFQLLKFHLPDMAKDGMPYNTITAHLSLKDGVLFSDDFLINSEAMGISAAGNVYLFHKKLDNIVGVHPLQTLDRIAAKIPIAGWLLTDENGHLLTVNFKVEGNWDDPEVTPIPARSIAKGTLEIFRRLFQLPEKIFTDTGEVILGR